MKIKFNDGREYDVFSVTHQMDVDDTDIKTGQPKKSLDIELSLFDYFFNVSCEEEERERRNLWAMVNNKIDRQIIKVTKI